MPRLRHRGPRTRQPGGSVPRAAEDTVQGQQERCKQQLRGRGSNADRRMKGARGAFESSTAAVLLPLLLPLL